MTTLLMTGFPGFLGSALLPRLLAKRPDAEAVCLVQDRYLGAARRRLAGLRGEHDHLAGRVSLVTGDITEKHLGLRGGDRDDLGEVSEVWHLAAVYDLTVPEAVAHRVNVDGTRRVLDLVDALPGEPRLQYVSTCYVSGAYDGEFGEDDLDVGQEFRNHYESTKFAAEVAVREAMGDGLAGSIYRPGIVVGDSRTGETQKYDGPYFLATFLRRQPPLAIVPVVGPTDEVVMSLVPRDFVVEAMDELSIQQRSIGRTYALTDPNPPTIRELVDTFADYLGRRVIEVPVPLGLARTAVGTVPGAERLLGIPAEGLDYFASRTTYSTAHTIEDLTGTGLVCPPFAEYATTLLDYMTAHPEVGSAAMV